MHEKGWFCHPFDVCGDLNKKQLNYAVMYVRLLERAGCRNPYDVGREV